MKEILTKTMTYFRKETVTKTMIFFLLCLCIGTFTACGKKSGQSAPDGAGADKKAAEDKKQKAEKKTETSKKRLPALSAREFKDVTYDTFSEAQKLDLYLPETGEGPFPLVVFIHGGGWFGGDKADGQEAAWVTLRSQGYAVASINYRLAAEASYPAGVLDCKTAIRFLKANKDRYHIDSDRVAVTGDSAGGHYALLTALTEENSNFQDAEGSYPEQDSSVRCVVVWYPMTDLTAAWQMVQAGIYAGLGDNAAWSSLKDFIGEDIGNITQEKLAEASPISYISERMAPVLLQHGSADTICPADQSRSFYREAVRSAGEEKVQLDIMEGAVHGDPVFETTENMERVRGFLARYLE